MVSSSRLGMERAFQLARELWTQFWINQFLFVFYSHALWVQGFRKKWKLPLISTGICLITGTWTTFSTIFSTGYGTWGKKRAQFDEFRNQQNSIGPLRWKICIQIPFVRCIHEPDTVLVCARLFRRLFLRDRVLERAPISRYISVREQSSRRVPERSSLLDTVSAPMHHHR